MAVLEGTPAHAQAVAARQVQPHTVHIHTVDALAQHTLLRGPV